MSHPSCLSILIIDDSTIDRMALRRLLKQDTRYSYRILEFQRVSEAMQWCQQEIPDVILVDFFLPDGNGLEFVRQLREQRKNTQSAVIVLTGQGDETIAVQVMKSGAQDYLVKDKLTPEVLQGAIYHGVERIRLNRQLEQSREQQQLINAIALRIRQSLNLADILRATAQEVREFLVTDRVVVYQFLPNMSGNIVAESVAPGLTAALGSKIEDTCFQKQQATAKYSQGKKRAIDDIYQAGLKDCHLRMLEQFEVKANLVVPILVVNRLWGLLIAHQCSAPRHWQAVELELLEQLAVQIAIAIQQASAYEQLQAELLERQRTQAALQISEERFRSTFEQAAVGMSHVSLEGKYIRFNQRFCEITGYPLEELQNLTFHEITHPEDLAKDLQQLEQLLAGNIQTYSMEKRYIRKDRSCVWINLTVSLMRDRFGAPNYFISVIEDITLRKQAEAALRENEERLQQLNHELEKRVEQRTAALRESEQRWHLAVRGSNDGIWDWNIQTDEIFLSSRWQEMRGFAEHEINYNVEQWLKQIHPEDRDRILTALADHLAGKSPLFREEYRYKCKDGSYIWVLDRGQALWDETGKAIRIAGSGTDITERKAAEAQLLSISRLQQAILESCDYGIISVNLAGIMQIFNPAAQKMLGYTADEVVGKLTPMIFHDQQELQQHAGALSSQLGREIAANLEFFTAISQQQQHYEHEWTFIRKDGSRFPVLLSITPLRDGKGQMMGLLGIAKDITQQKHMEAQLRTNAAHLTVAQRIANLGSWEFDVQTQTITWSEEVFRIYRRDPASGTPSYEEFRQMMHPEDRHLHELLVQQTFKYGLSYKEEYRIYRADGMLVHLLSRAELIFDDNGRPSRLIGTVMDITERKQAEIALRISQERLQLALEGSGDGLWDWNITTGELYLSPQWLYMLGYDENELPHDISTWSSLIHPEDKPWVMDLLNAHLQDSNAPYAFDYRLLTKSGEWKWIANYGKVVARDRNNAPLRMVGTHKDISDRKQTEAQLLAISRFQQAILDATDYSIISTDSQGIIQTFNAGAEKMFGYRPEEVVGLATPSDILHDQAEVEQQAAALSQKLGREIAPGLEFFTVITQLEQTYEEEWTYIRKDGSRFPVMLTVTGLYNDQGEIIGFLGVAKDITQQKQMAEQLRKSAAHLATAQRIAHLGSWEFNLQTQAIVWSEEVFRIFGREKESGIPTYEEMQNYIHPDDREHRNSMIQQAIALGHSYEIESRFYRQDGSLAYLLSRGEAILDGDGNPKQLIGTILDITQRKQLEEQLRSLSDRLTLALQSGAIGTWYWDIHHQLYWDDRMYELYGMQKSALPVLYQDWINTLHPDDVATLEASIQAAVQGETELSTEFRIIYPDFSIHFIKAAATVQRDEEGNPTRMVGISYDITERKHIEQALRESERRYATLAEASPVAIFRFDALGNCIYVNDRWCEMTGKTAQAAMGMGWLDTLHPEDRDDLFNAWSQATTQKIVYQNEGRCLRPDGSIIWFYVQAVPETDPNNKIIGYIGTLTDITSRKIVEEELVRQKKLREVIFNESTDALFLVDSQTLLNLDCNQRAVEMFEVADKAELIGIDGQTFQRQQLSAVEKAESLAQMQSKGFWSREIEYVTGEGNSFWGNIAAKPINVAGRNLNLVRITDISDRKQAEEVLAKYTRELADLYNNAPCGYHSLDPEGRFVNINHTELQWLGYTYEEIIGKLFTDFVTEKSCPVFLQHYPKFKKRGWVKDLELEMICQDGKILPVLLNATAVKSNDGTYLFSRSSMFDMRDRKLAEEAIMKYAREVEDLYNNAPCGYHSLDSEGCFIKVNATELQLLGYSREEILGQPLVNFLTEASRLAFEQNYPIFKQRGWAKDLEYDIVCKNGKIVPVLISATAVKDGNGNYLYSRANLFDLSDLKQAEQQLRQTNEQLARATRLKDEFLANMSHELRTPLNAILGMSEGFQEGVFGAINQRQAKAIATIERSGKHLLELINDILDLSKIESGKMELQLSEVSVSTLCDVSLAFIRQMALKKNISLSTNIANNIGKIQVDDRRIRQVLINLLNNAVKFTSTGGSVALEVDLETPGEVIANSPSNNTCWKSSVTEPNSKDSCYVCFRVTDTGIGIARENINKLFQPFVQLDSSLNRQYTGTGLGLALVQRIASLHGGTVGVSSELGRGSCFTVRIPYKKAVNCPIIPQKALLPSSRLLTANSPVLIIEDSVPAAEQITRYLKEMELQPIVYSQGEGVIDEVLRVEPVIIFLDIQLPNLSGWDVLNQLKANPKTKEIPVIIISVVDERTTGIVNGACEYLVKPITRTQFQATLEKVQYLIHPGLSGGKQVKQADLKTPLILLAEDNQANIDTMSGYLESRGYSLILAKNGQQALDFAKSQSPDLIVMDIQMPVMDGLEVMRRIRKEPQLVNVPIIALTALAMSGDREICLAAGANEYLTKPVKLKQLAITIQQLLAK